MKNQDRLWMVLAFLIILCAAFCGCIEEKPPKYAKPSETVQETSGKRTTIGVTQKSNSWRGLDFYEELG